MPDKAPKLNKKERRRLARIEKAKTKLPSTMLPVSEIPQKEVSKTSVKTEIGIEGILVIAAFLVDRAREWGDVKPNVFWEYGCWAAITLLLLRVFWILPLTAKLKRGFKLAVVILLPMALVIWSWQPAREKYRNQHDEANHKPLSLLDAQVDAARDSVRAWVGVTEVVQDIPFNDTKDPTVQIAIKNSGKVPANNVTGYIYVDYNLIFPPAQDQPVLGNADLKLFPKPLIMGGETRWVSGQMDFQRTKGWREQGLVPYAYVLGFIWYEDKFGKHVTKVCYFRKTDAPADVGFQPAPNNNWAK